MNFILDLERFCENLGHDIEKARAAARCTWATPAKVERTIPLSALEKISEMIDDHLPVAVSCRQKNRRNL